MAPAQEIGPWEDLSEELHREIEQAFARLPNGCATNKNEALETVRSAGIAWLTRKNDETGHEHMFIHEGDEQRRKWHGHRGDQPPSPRGTAGQRDLGVHEEPELPVRDLAQPPRSGQRSRTGVAERSGPVRSGSRRHASHRSGKRSGRTNRDSNPKPQEPDGGKAVHMAAPRRRNGPQDHEEAPR